MEKERPLYIPSKQLDALHDLAQKTMREIYIKANVPEFDREKMLRRATRQTDPDQKIIYAAVAAQTRKLS